jgi:hypothetical protein
MRVLWGSILLRFVSFWLVHAACITAILHSCMWSAALQHLLLDALATELTKEDNPGSSVQHFLQ